MLKLFISYCHEDEALLNKVLPVFVQMEKEKLIQVEYDRKGRPDNDLFETLDFQINDCKMAILFISDFFYSSKSCLNEKKRLISRKKTEGIRIFPLIAGSCDWLQDKEISHNWVLNRDGKALCQLSDIGFIDELNFINIKIREVINDLILIETLSTTTDFDFFLSDTEVFEKSHPSKNSLFLQDIFLFPTLKTFDNSKVGIRYISSENILSEDLNQVLLISGENQSGKTSLLKQLFIIFKKNLFLPIFFTSSDDFSGHIFNILEKKFKKIYKNNIDDTYLFLENNKENIIIFIDDFHKIINSSKILEKMHLFGRIILTVDIIYTIDFKSKNFEEKIRNYKISELSPTQRNKLLEKWLNLDDDVSSKKEIEKIKFIDEKTEIIEKLSSKSLRGGIMPMYPFIFLSLLSNFETLKKPLEQEITSYGYCYQALITIALTKIGLKKDTEIRGFFNFFMYFAYELHKKNTSELSTQDFYDFVDNYSTNYILPFQNKKEFIKKIEESCIIRSSSLGNYKFDYKYIFYFFIAKYLYEHNENKSFYIKDILNNIHKDKNAYIIIFFAHFSKSQKIAEMLINEANKVFPQYEIATLDKKMCSFFNEGYQTLIEQALPSNSHSFKLERKMRLEKKDFFEEDYHEEGTVDDKEQLDTELVVTLRKSIKIVEVMGIISKNHSTSLAISELLELVQEAINVNLRGLTSFFDLIKDTENQKEIINSIIDSFIDDEKEYDRSQYEKSITKIFWTMNFLYVYVILSKTIEAIGSEEIIVVLDKMVKQNFTPALEIILQGCKIIYQKNVDINQIIKDINNKSFSDPAKSIIKLMVIEFCKINPTTYSDRQRISQSLNIPIIGLKQKKDNKV